LELSIRLLRVLEELAHFNLEFKRRVTDKRKPIPQKTSTPVRATETGEDYNLCSICFDKPMQVVL